MNKRGASRSEQHQTGLSLSSRQVQQPGPLMAACNVSSIQMWVSDVDICAEGTHLQLFNLHLRALQFLLHRRDKRRVLRFQ